MGTIQESRTLYVGLTAEREKMNQVYFQFRKFQNIDANGNPVGEPTYGYAIWDMDRESYNNTYDSMDELIAAINAKGGLCGYLEENQVDFYIAFEDVGLWINFVFYSWEDLQAYSLPAPQH